jgi:hypothetical protein
MRSVLIAALVGVGLTVGGCGDKSVCDGATDLCIALHVEGTGGLDRVDQLALSVGGAFTGARKLTPATPDDRALPVDVALLLPRGTRGQIALSMEALRGGTLVGLGMTSITIDSDGPFSKQVMLLSLNSTTDGGMPELDGGTTDGGTRVVGCPSVMFILDRTGSMSSNIVGGTRTRLAIAKEGMLAALMKHSNRAPYGLTVFDHNQSDCFAGVETLVTPKTGTEATIASALATVVPGGGSNVGEAVEAVFLSGAMHDPRRAPSHIILITDGSANCDPREGAMSTATRIRVQAVASAGVKVHVLAPGLSDIELADVDVYAAVGAAPCAGPLCRGHAVWPAGSAQDVTDMLDAILTRIENQNPSCASTLPPSVLCPSASPTAGCAAADVCCATGGCNQSCAQVPYDLGGLLPSLDMVPPQDLSQLPDMTVVDLARVD